MFPYIYWFRNNDRGSYQSQKNYLISFTVTSITLYCFMIGRNTNLVVHRLLENNFVSFCFSFFWEENNDWKGFVNSYNYPIECSLELTHILRHQQKLIGINNWQSIPVPGTDFSIDFIVSSIYSNWYLTVRPAGYTFSIFILFIHTIQFRLILSSKKKWKTKSDDTN